tara:strand:- start:2161 stop:2364 length:204 start_codon:yes stop_codon:yes gene_type:complete
MDKLTCSISKLNKKRGEEIVKLNEKINNLEIEITNLKYFIKQIHREYSDKIEKLLNDKIDFEKTKNK